jgi:GNAT superfamily N-acetyltransferase
MVSAAGVVIVIITAWVLTRIYHGSFIVNLMLGLMTMGVVLVSNAVRQWRAGWNTRAARLRPARAEEAGPLTELALRSKARWGYEQSFLDACRAELTLRPEEIEARRVVVAESAGAWAGTSWSTVRAVGFYSLDGQPPAGEIGNLWIEPDATGHGVGRALWRHAIQAARDAGFTTLRIEADPHAERFYRAMGARPVGVAPSGSVPGRTLPVLEFHVS